MLVAGSRIEIFMDMLSSLTEFGPATFVLRGAARP
jgi:hypothetical protein